MRMMKLALVLVVVLCFVGCTPKTESHLHPGTMLTRPQVAQEIAAIKSKQKVALEELNTSIKIYNLSVEADTAWAEAADADLAAQEEHNAQLFDVASGLATIVIPAASAASGPLAPIVGIGLTTLMAGLAVYFKRKESQKATMNTALVGTVQNLKQQNQKVTDALPAAIEKAIENLPLSITEYSANVKDIKAQAKILQIA